MSRSFIIILLSAFVIVGGGFFFVLHWGSQLPTPLPEAIQTAHPSPPAPPPPPSVTVAEQKSKGGNIIFIQWSNLPDGTTELKVFRSPKGKDQWSLWKTISLAGSDLSNGSAQFNIGKSDYSNYDFYTEAEGTGGNGGTVNTTSTLWTSNPVPPVITAPPAPTSTPPVDQGNNNPTSTPTSTPPPPPPPPPPNPTSTNNPPPTPSGTPYYNPQVQISSYGQTPAANFWVQHVDQTIQIGWQNISPIATEILISRAPTSTGPWVPLLTQENPSSTGSYSLQVVDDTVSQPYYYLMNANAGSTTVATYGPAYLPPVGQ